MTIAKITQEQSTITPDLSKMQREIEQVPRKGYIFFKEHTPIRSGRARRSTVLENNTTIAARYPYAQRLDQGASRQAPDGMSKPTMAFLKKQFDKIFKGR